MAGRRFSKVVTALIVISQYSLHVQLRVTSEFLKAQRNESEPDDITLNDIFICVKTTRYFQRTRLPIILKTWFQLAKEQIWFFTDIDDPLHQKVTNGHMVNTKCDASHTRKGLCCKTSVQYDYYLKTNKSWFCYFDDDNYVNVPRLVTVLQRYDYKEDWYLGQISVDAPTVFENKHSYYTFRFGTGGAGVCVSRSLALKVSPYVSGKRLIAVCDYLHYGDDVALGYIIENLVIRRLTVVPEFHSHLENMTLLDASTFTEQVSFGYHLQSGSVVNVTGFAKSYDRTRFLSLHCFLFPHFTLCQPLRNWHKRSKLVKKDRKSYQSTNHSHACMGMPSVL